MNLQAKQQFDGVTPAENQENKCLIFKSNTVVNDKDNFKKTLPLKDSDQIYWKERICRWSINPQIEIKCKNT